MNRTLLSKRISSLLAEVSRLSNALCAMNTMDLQRYPENYELLSTDAALRAEQIACRMRHLVYGFTTVQKHEYLTSAANVLGITITAHMTAAEFLRVDTLLILGLGLIAFVFDTVGGVLFAKIMNLFVKNKVNPMIGAAGISAFPMSARIIQKMGQQEDPQNFLLMHAAGVNVGGQIASVIAGGLILNLIARV